MTGEKEEALQWYKRGIVELESGIAVNISGQGNPPVTTWTLRTVLTSSDSEFGPQEINTNGPRGCRRRW